MSVSSYPIAQALRTLIPDGMQVVTSTLQPLIRTTCSTNQFIGNGDPGSNYLTFSDGSQEEELNHFVSFAEFKVEGGSTANNSNESVSIFWRKPPTGISMHSLLYAEGPLDGAGFGEGFFVIACTLDIFWVQASIEYNLSTNSIVSQLDDFGEQQKQNTRPPTSVSALWTEEALKTWPYPTIKGQMDPLADLSSGINHYNSGVSTFLTSVITAAAFVLFTISDATLPPVECMIYNNTGDFKGSGYGSVTDQQQESFARYVNEKTLGKRCNQFSLSTTTNWTDPSKLTQIPVQQYRYGYGYDSSSVPVQLSLAVLLLYCIIALLYIIFTLFTGRTASSWDTFSELLMLGVHSRAPAHLDNTSVGIDTLATFREPVSIRINEENKAELVFEKDAETMKRRLRNVVQNEAY